MLHARQSATSPRPARRTQPSGRAEALSLLALALATAALFANGKLDIAMARWFYRPESPGHWPLAQQPPWSLLYAAATWITAALVIAALVALVLSFTRTRGAWRRPAVLVLLGVAIGPGLLGNVLFKDHWQHPRPRDLVQFGGPLHYAPSPLRGSESGASFPCGHCTVGFMYACGWWIWRARRRRWAAASLACALVLGLLLGVGRMAAGAHFFSDVVWSALLAFGVLHLLHYHVLQVAAAVPSGARRWSAGAALLAGAAVLLALLAAPHGTQLTARVPLASLPLPRVLEVEADTANIVVVLLDARVPELAIDGELHGFGLPASRLSAHLAVLASQSPTRVRYRIEARGALTDVDGTATLRVPATAFARVTVSVHRGDIRVTDETREGVVRSGRVQLALHTDRGYVQR